MVQHIYMKIEKNTNFHQKKRIEIFYKIKLALNLCLSCTSTNLKLIFSIKYEINTLSLS